jgi:PAS domain S-box-containing protein
VNSSPGSFAASSTPDERESAAAARLHSLIESLDVIVWEADPATARLTYVGGAVRRLLGHAPADWLAPGFRERAVHPDDREWVVARWSRQRPHGEDDRFEYRVLTAEGRVVWLRESLRVVRPEQGAPGVMQGVLVDITREKLAESRLREQCDLNAAVLDGVEAFVVVLDAGGSVVRANRACEDALGRPAGELAGRPFAEAFAPASKRGAVESALAAALAGRGLLPVELDWRPADGGERGVTWTFTPLRDSEGRPIVVATGIDVTERQRIARELRLHEAAPGISAGLEPYGRRVARIAHDYNNALTGLLGFADMLAMTLKGDESALRQVDELRISAERVADLTTRLRALAAEATGTTDAPAEAAAPSPAAGETARDAAGPVTAGERVVLLAEDEGIVRRLMIQTLRREGWRVLDAPSAPEALRLARESGVRLDLLVTDVVMPGMSGRELAERLRREQPELPVLFVTGFSSEADPRRLPGRSAALLLKPFLPEGLVSGVRELLLACAR